MSVRLLTLFPAAGEIAYRSSNHRFALRRLVMTVPLSMALGETRFFVEAGRPAALRAERDRRQFGRREFYNNPRVR